MGTTRPRGSMLLVSLLVACTAHADALPCEPDDRLAETAASLLLRTTPLDAASLLPTARAHGFEGVALHALDDPDERAVRAFLERLSHQGEGRLSCGEARSEARRLVLATLRGGRLWRKGARLFGRLEPGFDAPGLVIEAEGGALTAFAVTRAQLAAGIVLSSESPLRRVQLSAESASGPRPVAELELAPRSASAPLAAASGPAYPPSSPLASLDALRRVAGVGSLRDNRLLAESAQQHGAALCARGLLAHRLDGEDPEQRLRRVRVVARSVGEVLARAGSIDAAFDALRDSPAHRLTMLRPDFTDVGIGHAADAAGRVCLVVVFASWPRRLP